MKDGRQKIEAYFFTSEYPDESSGYPDESSGYPTHITNLDVTTLILDISDEKHSYSTVTKMSNGHPSD
uniref:Uncharacterized protein n=1 Tax=Romanomermis culicivorax TaxID=13658 RepID=A0A915KHG3_ROMCU